MILHVMSDTHLEFLGQEALDINFKLRLEAKARDEPPRALVLAGDIDVLATMRRGAERPPLLESLEWFASLYPDVIYVPGNHEHADVGIADGYELLKQVPANVHVLRPHRPAVTIDGTRFTGGTMWYPDCEDHWLKRGWFDYRMIPDADPEIHACHDLFREQVLPDMGDVVVTHMFPTDESINPKFQGANTNVFFCAELDSELVKHRLPKLWIHGHTHCPFDYRSRHGFRVFCNPKGYPFEGENPRFWDRIRVDTEDQNWYLKTLNGSSNDD